MCNVKLIYKFTISATELIPPITCAGHNNIIINYNK